MAEGEKPYRNQKTTVSFHQYKREKQTDKHDELAFHPGSKVK